MVLLLFLNYFSIEKNTSIKEGQSWIWFFFCALNRRLNLNLWKNVYEWSNKTKTWLIKFCVRNNKLLYFYGVNESRVPWIYFRYLASFCTLQVVQLGRQLMFLIFDRLLLYYLFLFGCNDCISYDFFRPNIATKQGKNDQIKIIKTILVWKMKVR